MGVFYLGDDTIWLLLNTWNLMLQVQAELSDGRHGVDLSCECDFAFILVVFCCRSDLSGLSLS